MLDSKIEINTEFKQALDLLENTNDNIFITGNAGTGKSTLLKLFRQRTKRNVVILAPTGISAINSGGQTIHSFFHFSLNITPEKIRLKPKQKRKVYESLDAIIIDEVSMVRADLMDCVDRFLRVNRQKPSVPFGGVRMILIGDLYQLPPVVKPEQRDIFKFHYSTPFFFSARVFNPDQTLFETKKVRFKYIELKKIYRQNDDDFINILNNIRLGKVEQQDLDKLNSRHDYFFNPPVDEFWIRLSATNREVKQINEQYLESLSGKKEVYEAQVLEVGDDKIKDYPADKILSVKVGAQVMMLNNDMDGRWVNGTLGKVVEIQKNSGSDEDLILVKLDTGKIQPVKSHIWDIYKWAYDQQERQITARRIGSFAQYPFRLAWAITIHKSQGKTFKKVILDLKNVFAPGQVYVALSRCETLGGIVLKNKLNGIRIFNNDIIEDYLQLLRTESL